METTKMEFTAEEMALLAKVGLSETDLKALIKPAVKAGKDKPASINIDLSTRSGKKNLKCSCCGTTTAEYVDFVKRKDTEGFAIKTVKVPTNAVTEEFTYHVKQCEYCSDEALSNRTNKELIDMIKNLRRM
jgi:hypothetical protein